MSREGVFGAFRAANETLQLVYPTMHTSDGLYTHCMSTAHQRIAPSLLQCNRQQFKVHRHKYTHYVGFAFVDGTDECIRILRRHDEYAKLFNGF